MDELKDGIEANADVLGRASVILSECVIHFCLKVLYSDTESAREKEKKRGLLISQWSSVQSEARGMKKEWMHPLLAQGAEMHNS